MAALQTVVLRGGSSDGQTTMAPPPPSALTMRYREDDHQWLEKYAYNGKAEGGVPVMAYIRTSSYHRTHLGPEDGTVPHVDLECTDCGGKKRASTRREVNQFQSEHDDMCEEGSVAIDGQYAGLPLQ